MAVNLPPLETLLPVSGVRLGTTCAGIRRRTKDDVAVFAFEPGTTCAGVFTQSAFRAAPVAVAQEHLARGSIRALLINSGNANAATGARGVADARTSCAAVAIALGVEAGSVLPFSTGVIGEPLPMDRLRDGIAPAVAALRADGWASAAHAIMTTDTAPKALSRQIALGGQTITITGIAKGAGMIRPDMATMLAFVATDAAVTESALRAFVRRAADRSFNRITVDGDTSTNDSFVVAATGRAGNPPIATTTSAEAERFFGALCDVARELAQRIIRDAEGATKFVTVHVRGGRTEDECARVAYTIAESPLVKTALFASDPNWGRFCMAIGRAGIRDLDTSAVSLDLDDIRVAERGMIASTYTEAAGARVMAQPEFTVRVDLGRGDAQDTVWTCDLSYDYVKINAEYRT
jgi:glutamate N-acetyltransferase/amino-acid N-acetyltransferase